MKPKSLLRIVALVAIMVSAFGANTLASADEATPAQIVMRTTTYWDATFYGNVDATRFERWPFQFGEENTFTVTVTPTAGDLVPAVLLLDSAGNEITRATGTLLTTQPAGSYFVQIQPDTGSGAYGMTIRRADVPVTPPPPTAEPSVSTSVDPASILVGGTAAVTVRLDNVPAEGYAAAEFACTFDAAVLEASNIADAGLFGSDAAMAVNGPANGSFIAAVAGSNGQKAAASGVALTFTVKGLQVGQSAIECKVRVSKGDATLVSLPSTAAALSVIVAQGTVAGQVLASKPVTITLYNADNSVAGTATAAADGTFSLAAAGGSYTVTAAAEGFLGAQGAVTVAGGATSTKATISLIAGDVDGNGVIDQFDAMTIGINYNAAAPAAADLNNDGTINVLDLELLAANYRKSGALAWE